MTTEKLNTGGDSRAEGLGRYSDIIAKGAGNTALAPLLFDEDVAMLLAGTVPPAAPEDRFKDPFDSVTESDQPAFLTGTPGVEAPSIEALIQGIVPPVNPGRPPFDAVTEPNQPAFLVQ